MLLKPWSLLIGDMSDRKHSERGQRGSIHTSFEIVSVPAHLQPTHESMRIRQSKCTVDLTINKRKHFLSQSIFRFTPPRLHAKRCTPLFPMCMNVNSNMGNLLAYPRRLHHNTPSFSVIPEWLIMFKFVSITLCRCLPSSAMFPCWNFLAQPQISSREFL